MQSFNHLNGFRSLLTLFWRPPTSNMKLCFINMFKRIKFYCYLINLYFYFFYLQDKWETIWNLECLGICYWSSRRRRWKCWRKSSFGGLERSCRNITSSTGRGNSATYPDIAHKNTIIFRKGLCNSGFFYSK